MNELKIAFIGTHGVGKTTLCYGLAARLKARDVVLEIVHEVARRCPLPINERTSIAAQPWILHTQIGDELVATARHPVVICDRSVLDNYVYLLLSGGRQAELEAMISWWLGTYDRLIYVPIVGEPRDDGMRSTDLAFQQAVDRRLMREIDERKLGAMRLDPEDREGWLDTVEDVLRERIDTRQLKLL